MLKYIEEYQVDNILYGNSMPVTVKMNEMIDMINLLLKERLEQSKKPEAASEVRSTERG